MAAGLEQNSLAAIEQALHQRIDVLLEQRLAAGHFYERAVEAVDLTPDRVEFALAAFMKRVRGIAPRAAKITRGEPHEHTRLTCIRRLALHRVEDLVDREHADPKRLLYCSWAFASAPRAGAIRRGKGNGTASSIPRAVRRRRALPDSTSCASTPSTSIRWRSTPRSTGSRAPRWRAAGSSAHREDSSS